MSSASRVKVLLLLLLLGIVFVGCGEEKDVGGPGPERGDYVLLPAGTFSMGSPETEPQRDYDETRHMVTLTRAFYISRYEVTEALWDEVMGAGASTSSLPKTTVSWTDAVAFCNAMSVADGLTPAYTISGPFGDATWDQDASGWRLPTEAEWEYACRAGPDSTAFFCGAMTQAECAPVDPLLDGVAWYCGNSNNSRHPVGQKPANAWGLHDMHGNVWEWCWDLYRVDYEALPATDPVSNGFVSTEDRIIRGGSFSSTAKACRCAIRWGYGPYESAGPTGFRVVRTAG